VAQQTGGVMLTQPEEVFSPPEVFPRTHTDIWRTLLWIAALLLPLDIAVRRLYVRAADVAEAVAAVRARLASARGRAAPESGTVDHLLQRQREVRHDREAPPTPPIIPPSGPARPGEATPPAAAERPPEKREPEPPPPEEEGLSTTDRLLRRQRERRGE